MCLCNFPSNNLRRNVSLDFHIKILIHAKVSRPSTCINSHVKLETSRKTNENLQGEKGQKSFTAIYKIPSVNYWGYYSCFHRQSWNIAIINQPQKGPLDLRLHQSTNLNLNPRTFSQVPSGAVKSVQIIHLPRQTSLESSTKNSKSTIVVISRRTISNSIFKLNIVRFMHTKDGVRNLFCQHEALHIFAEARIFNYKSHFAFFFQSLFLLPSSLELWIKVFYFTGNKWSFFSAPHSFPCHVIFRSLYTRID